MTESYSESPVVVAWSDPDAGVLTVTLNRPRVLNAIDRPMLESLEEAFTSAVHGQKARCIVITGTGERAFSSGADLRVVERLTPETAKEWIRDGHRLFNSIVLCPVPTIAAIRGYALGGGLELALACDFRVVSESAQMGFPEASRGWLPGWGGMSRLGAIAGPSVARAMVLGGQRFSGREAISREIADIAVPDAELELASLAFARRLARLDPAVTQLAKRQLCPSGLLIDEADVEIDAEFLATVVKARSSSESPDYGPINRASVKGE